jgi:hypothetical protein
VNFESKPLPAPGTTPDPVSPIIRDPSHGFDPSENGFHFLSRRMRCWTGSRARTKPAGSPSTSRGSRAGAVGAVIKRGPRLVDWRIGLATEPRPSRLPATEHRAKHSDLFPCPPLGLACLMPHLRSRRPRRSCWASGTAIDRHRRLIRRLRLRQTVGAVALSYFSYSRSHRSRSKFAR